jgi:hypothetical protein
MTAPDDERQKLRDAAETAGDVVVDTWPPGGPPPEAALKSFIRLTNERLRRIETGSFADQEIPTKPSKRTASQEFRLETVKTLIREGRAAAGLEPELSQEELDAIEEDERRTKIQERPTKR